MNFVFHCCKFFFHIFTVLSLLDSAEAVEMLPPVRCIDTDKANRIACMNHHTVSCINADMRNRGAAVVGVLKKDYISRLCFTWRYGIAVSFVYSPSGCSWHILDTRMGKTPAHKGRTVEVISARSPQIHIFFPICFSASLNSAFTVTSSKGNSRI